MVDLYIPYTPRVYKDGVCLFEARCELGIAYSLPDGRYGPVDWDVEAFSFADTIDGKTTYAEVRRGEPLFGILYADLDRDWIDEQVTGQLADDDVISLTTPPYAPL